MGFIISLLINATIIFLLAYAMKGITIRSYGTALVVALVIGILNATLGFLIRLPINIITLGLLSFFVSLFVTAIIIYIVDKFFKGFEVKNFTTALILAFIMAIVNTLLNMS